MAHFQPTVTFKPAAPDHIPDEFAPAIALLLQLHQDQALQAIHDRLKIRREGGFCAFDVFLFFLLYFSSTHRTGLRKFAQRLRPYHRAIAALAQRDALPSASSVSRALNRVQMDLIEPDIPWLLTQATGADDLLKHPCVQTLDANGHYWQVFDFDPTNTTLRHRALPADPQLPLPIRRAEALAQPGYSGRKRGEIQFRRSLLQHAGSGLWLHMGADSGCARQRRVAS